MGDSLVIFLFCAMSLLVVMSSVIQCQNSNDLLETEETLQTPVSEGSKRSAANGNPLDVEPAECYVEVRQTRLLPGRCLPVGRRTMPHLCQSKDRQYISMHSGCAAVLENKKQKNISK